MKHAAFKLLCILLVISLLSGIVASAELIIMESPDDIIMDDSDIILDDSLEMSEFELDQDDPGMIDLDITESTNGRTTSYTMSVGETRSLYASTSLGTDYSYGWYSSGSQDPGIEVPEDSVKITLAANGGTVSTTYVIRKKNGNLAIFPFLRKMGLFLSIGWG